MNGISANQPLHKIQQATVLLAKHKHLQTQKHQEHLFQLPGSDNSTTEAKIPRIAPARGLELVS
jgi:hypothetical protein